MKRSKDKPITKIVIVINRKLITGRRLRPEGGMIGRMITKKEQEIVMANDLS